MTQNSFQFRRVSERITSAAAALAITALLAIASDAQAAGLSVQIAPSVSVPYSSDALATEEGTANLYRALKHAAREVCDVHGIKTLAQYAVAQKCFEKSLENAVHQVNAQRLTALHAAEMRALG